MLTAIWEIDRLHAVDMMPPGEFQHRVLLDSYYGSFAGESLSGEGKSRHFD
jgi:hypothetical protein